MITTFRAKNFKCLRDFSTSLEPFTLFLGANGSGKSSILQGLHYCCQLGHEGARSLFTGERALAKLYSRRGKGDLVLGIEGTWDAQAGKVSWSAPLPDPEVNGNRWEYRFSGEHEAAFNVRVEQDQLAGGPLRKVSGATRLGEEIGRVVYLRFESRRLAAPAFADVTPPRVEFDGEGLAAVLAEMALNQPDQFQQLQDRLREVIPNLVRIRFAREPVVQEYTVTVPLPDGDEVEQVRHRKVAAHRIVFDMQHADDLPAYLLSEGTLFVLGMLTVLMGPVQPRLVLLDDIDRALHPKAMQDLVRQVMKIVDGGDVQVVATAHSPYLVDCVDADQVRVTALDAQGATHAKRLSDHHEFPKWKDQMRAGEFWSLVGEDWAARP